MIKKALLVLTIISFVCAGTAVIFAASPNAVLGVWKTSKKADAGKVTIYKCGSKFCGKLSWIKNPEDKDTKNPNPAKRNRKLLGTNIVWGFVYDDGEWVDGKIYDPNNGKTYSCKMWLESNNVLKVKGYIGISLIGRSTTWYRSN